MFQSSCGPVWFSQATGNNPTGTTYSWVKTGGAGTLVTLATRNNGADAYLKASGGSVSFKRVTTFNGVTCESSVFTLNINCPCENLSVSVSGAAGCANPAAVPYTVTVQGVDLQNKRIQWTPAYAFDNDSILSPTIITTDNITITATVNDKFDPTTTCAYTLLINRPDLAVPVFNISDITTCPNTPVSIGQPNNPDYTYTWNNTAGMADPNVDSKISNPTVSVGNTQQYEVRVTHTESGCSITRSMRVIVPNISVNAGPNQTVCLNETITVGAEPLEGTNYTYAWTPAGSAWTNGTGSTDAMPDLIVGAGAQTLVLTAFDAASGCSKTDTVIITGTSEVPLPALMNQSICPGSQTTIGGVGTNGISYQWIPATGLDCATCPNTLASPEETTTYTLIATGCGSTSSGEVTVTVFTPEDYTLEDRDVCPSDGGEIGIGATGNTSGLSNVTSFSWSPRSNLSCSDCPNPIANPIIPTLYTLTVRYNDGCEISKPVLISPLPSVNTNLVTNVTLCAGEDIQLGGDPFPGSTYSWTPATGLSCTECANPVASPEETTSYTLTVTAGECTATGTVTIKVITEAPVEISGVSSVCAGGSTTLSTAVQSGMVYAWFPETGVENPTSASTLITPPATETYTLTRTNTRSGCSATASIGGGAQ
jgi:hypothetical protein